MLLLSYFLKKNIIHLPNIHHYTKTSSPVFNGTTKALTTNCHDHHAGSLQLQGIEMGRYPVA